MRPTRTTDVLCAKFIPLGPGYGAFDVSGDGSTVVGNTRHASPI
jgi:hypothetical protein